MSDLTVDLEYGSTSSSPLLQITFSPENEIMTAPQSQSPNLEPLSSLEHGSTSASPLFPPENEILTALLSQSSNLEPLSSYEYGSTSALPEIQMAETIPPTFETPQYEFQYSPENENLLSIETRKEYIEYGVPFYHAAIKGDCRKAERICEVHPGIVRARITYKSETGLHIAAAAKNLPFVKMLVKKMTSADICMISNSKNTALCFAAVSGIVEIAKVMVEKVKVLPLVRGERGMTPLHIAAELGHKDMVNYLLPLTVRDVDVDKKKKRQLTDVDVVKMLTADEIMELFISLINTNLYEVALEILKKHPTLATARDKQGQGETALHVLARKPLSSKVHLDIGNWKGLLTSDALISAFSINASINSHNNNKALLLIRNLWKYVVQTLDDFSISQLIAVPTHLLFVATKSGNVEFITILIKYYPDLIWCVDHEKRSMFQVAVYERQESIFRIIYEIGAIKDLIAERNDSKNNNVLHMAAKLAPSNRLDIVSGAAFQLQRELIWFKEVERIVLPSYKETKNTEGEGEGLTPKEVFDKDHKELREEGEKWMKSTAQSCMLVSTLIATVMFAAVFNLPGGRRADGTPTYLKKPSFIIFVIADSMSLFSSITTIFVFLSILTSRYKEEDFLYALPNKLIHGLLALLVSMLLMMIAFTASMFIIFHGKLIPVAYVISCAAVIPVIYYLFLHYRLFADMYSSTYNSKFIFQSQGVNPADDHDSLEEMLILWSEEREEERELN